MGVVFLVTQLFLRGALIGAFAFVASLVPWKIPDDSALSALLAFVALDFVYYVQHRRAATARSTRSASRR